jgi:hypothetical protein
MKEDVKHALQKRAEEVSAAADFIMGKTRDWQMIKQYLSNRTNEIVLTDEQEKKMERYQYIYNQMVTGRYTDQEVINQVKKFYKIKTTQAYEDMNGTREVFNSVININKQFEINLQLQINRKLLRKAEELGDMKACAAFEKNRALLIKQLPEENEMLGELFEGHIYEMTFDPSLLGAPPVNMKELLQKINAKRNKAIKTDMFEEIEYKDVPKDGN